MSAIAVAAGVALTADAVADMVLGATTTGVLAARVVPDDTITGVGAAVAGGGTVLSGTGKEAFREIEISTAMALTHSQSKSCKTREVCATP